MSNLDVSRVAAIVKSCDRHILIDVTRLKPDVSCVTYDCHDMSFDSDSTMTSYDTESPPTVLEPWKRQTVSPWELYRELKRRQAEAELDESSGESEYSTFTTDCSLSDVTSFFESPDNSSTPAMTSCGASDASTQTTNPRMNQPRQSLSRNSENLSVKTQNSVKYLRDVMSQSRDLSVRSKVAEKGTRSRSSVGGQSNRSQLSEDSGIEVATRSSVFFHVCNAVPFPPYNCIGSRRSI